MLLFQPGLEFKAELPKMFKPCGSFDSKKKNKTCGSFDPSCKLGGGVNDLIHSGGYCIDLMNSLTYTSYLILLKLQTPEVGCIDLIIYVSVLCSCFSCIVVYIFFFVSIRVLVFYKNWHIFHVIHTILRYSCFCVIFIFCSCRVLIIFSYRVQNYRV